MAEKLTLMCVLAHPDDESLGVGGVLAKYASEGVFTCLVTATRGERGRFGDEAQSPGPEIVGKVREGELRAAANELGVKEVRLLDYLDGELDRADSAGAIRKVVRHLRELRPDVVVTFGPEGAYGHPDHIAVSQLAAAAIVCAADPHFQLAGDTAGQFPPHRVAKLYYMAWRAEKWALFQAAFRPIKINVDGTERQASPWPGWAVTTVVDTAQHWPAVWRAIRCHKTQIAIYRNLGSLTEDQQRALWGSQEFYRVFSTVNGGREIEDDLFAGLRKNARSRR